MAYSSWVSTGAGSETIYNPNWEQTVASGTGSVSSVSGTGTVSGITLSGTVTSTGSLTLGGTLSLNSGNVTTALGFTPYNATNPSGYLSSITSNQVTTALGFTPYNATNPSSYISSITSNMVTTALGFTPYNDTNPSSYITATNTTFTSSSNISFSNTPYLLIPSGKLQIQSGDYLGKITVQPKTTALPVSPQEGDIVYGY